MLSEGPSEPITAALSPEMPPVISHSRVAKNASIYLISQVVSWLVALVSVSLIPRALGEVGQGRIAIIGAIYAPLSFASLGIDQLLIAEVGRNRENAGALLRAVFGLRIVFLLIMPPVALSLLHFAHLSPLLWQLGFLTMVSGVPNGFAEPMRSVFAGLEQARRVALIDLIAAACPLLAVPFLYSVAFDQRPAFVTLVAMGAAYLTLLLRWHWLRPLLKMRPAFAPAHWRRLIAGGLPFMINTWVLTMYGATTIYILRYFTNEAEVGVYASAQRLFGTFLFVPTAIGSAILPSLTRLADSDAAEFRQIQSRVVGLLIILGLPVMTLLLFLAHPLCRLIYGPDQYQGLPLVLQILAPSIIPLYLVTTTYQFLVAQKRNAVWTFFLLLSIGICALSSYLLVPLGLKYFHNGATGVSAATFISETISTLFALILLRSNPFTVEMVGRVARAILATVGMALVLWLTRGFFLLVPASLGIATFVLLAWQLRILTPDEQEQLVAKFRGKFRRR